MTRISEAERVRRRKRLVAAYRKGFSVREIAKENSYSYGHVHKLLEEAGEPMRPRGGNGRPKK